MDNSIRALYEIVSPMFLGGAGHEAGDIRASSFKSEMVFWWRALNFAAVQLKTPNEQAIALRNLHHEEVRLFGGPANGQGVFLLKTGWVEKKGITKAGTTVNAAFGTKNPSGTGIHYLGYGLVDVNGKLASQKECVNAGAAFAADLTFRPNVAQSDILALVRVLHLIGLIGGLGARHRRGWGSLALISLRHGDTLCHSPGTVDEFDAVLRDIVAASADFNETGSPLSCFGANTQVKRWADGFPSAMKAMNELGNGYQLYRAWGYKGKYDSHHKVGGQKAHQNFKADHDWFKDNRKAWAKARPSNTIPLRGVFGFPLNFQTKDFPETLAVAPAAKDRTRRASPLLFHIAKIGEKYHPIATWMNNLFLPVEMHISADWDKSNIKADAGFYFANSAVIANYLDGRRRSTDGGYPYFDGVDVNVRGQRA